MDWLVVAGVLIAAWDFLVCYHSQNSSSLKPLEKLCTETLQETKT
jgi:hypothetical protein